MIAYHLKIRIIIVYFCIYLLIKKIKNNNNKNNKNKNGKYSNKYRK